MRMFLNSVSLFMLIICQVNFVMKIVPMVTCIRRHIWRCRMEVLCNQIQRKEFDAAHSFDVGRTNQVRKTLQQVKSRHDLNDLDALAVLICISAYWLSCVTGMILGKKEGASLWRTCIRVRGILSSQCSQ